MRIRAFDAHDEADVIALWAACDLTRPWNDPRKDIERKLVLDDGGLLVGELDGTIVASVMVGYDGHRGWINYLAVDPSHQGAGYGRALLGAAEAWLDLRGCAKVNLQVRDTNAAAMAFYEAIGYTRDETVSFGKRLVVDE